MYTLEGCGCGEGKDGNARDLTLFFTLLASSPRRSLAEDGESGWRIVGERKGGLGIQIFH